MSWLPLVVTVPPAAEPLSVADATLHVRADPSNADDQAYLLGLTKAARSYVENWTGLKLVTQTVALRRGDFVGEMRFPVAPMQSITSVQYLDPAKALQTLDPAVWEASLYGLAPSIRVAYNQAAPVLYASPEAIIVTAVVGFATLTDPELDEVRMAMKLLVGQWYDNRNTFTDTRMTELPNVVESLLANKRVFAGAY